MRPTRADSPSLMASALQYASMGIPVHPLLVGGKAPRWRDWPDRATTDPDTIRGIWGRAPYNIGVVCGEQITVLDLDVPKTGDGPTGVEQLSELAAEAGQFVPSTMSVRTPTGGWHLIYQTPTSTEVRCTAKTVASQIDTRAHGGYVVGIDSIVNGHPYTLVGSITTPAVLPPWLLTLITTTPQPPKAGGEGQTAGTVSRLTERVRHGSREERWADGILRSECADLASVGEGGRNARLNLASYRCGQLVGAGLLEADLAIDDLTTAAGTAGLGDTETHKTITSGMQAGIARPRQMGGAA